MRRRDFVGATLVAAIQSGSALAQAAPPRAVPGKTYRLAVVHPSLAAKAIGESSPLYVTMFNSLRELGYVSGQNLKVEPYSADGFQDRWAAVAAEVVAAKPDAIHVTINPFVHAFQVATKTIPIVGAIADPIALGTVTSMSRPGGNFTGVTTETGNEFWGKRFQLMRELLPQATALAYIATTFEWNGPLLRKRREMFEQLGGKLTGPWFDDWTEDEVRRGLDRIVSARPEGAVVTDNGSVLPRMTLVRTRLNESRIPAIYPWPAVARYGGLIAYGQDGSEWGRDTAHRIHMVLNGVPAGEIPIAQPSRYELVVNLKTAKGMGVEVATSILAAADEVIE